MDRKSFLKFSGVSILPSFPEISHSVKENVTAKTIKLYGDGEMFNPSEYLQVLNEINSIKAIQQDSYGQRGAVNDLEKKFAEITGKEQAIFMPTGTMANQFAISVLSGENTKVFVQETSHVYRDEADAAQSVFNKRLIPVAKGEAFFTAAQLEEAVDYHNRGEVFKSGMGAVSIEIPVRRAMGRMVPYEELKKIAAVCKKNNLKLHLDGARIHMASAWSGVSIADYASLFDTIYISLYKYLGAAAGAILCGKKEIIEKMPHLIKIHGGTMFSNWTNAAMVLHRLDGVEDRLKRAITASKIIFDALNGSGIKVTPLENGTNIHRFTLDKTVEGGKFVAALAKENIIISSMNNENETAITINETLLYREPKKITDTFLSALKTARAK